MARDPHAPSGAPCAPAAEDDRRVVAFMAPSIPELEWLTGAPIGELRSLEREGTIDIWRRGDGPYVITGASWRR